VFYIVQSNELFLLGCIKKKLSISEVLCDILVFVPLLSQCIVHEEKEKYFWYFETWKREDYLR
jgi:hypothetical protein